MDDQKIKADILMRIRRDSRINDATVDVRVRKGHVELTGMVPSYKKKLALQLKTKKTRGVASVDNRVQVFYPNEIGNPPPAAIKETAMTILMASSDIDGSRIEIEMDAGVMRLKGSVTWFWQLQRVEEMVSNIIGVMEVKNEMTVVPSEDISDEKISRDIVAELEESDNIDLSQLVVEVENGTVILSGSVSNYAAESEAYEATIQQPGVTQVINNMVVKANP
jgi:osmotically-inducible protein OsmY